ncbi:TadE/TadG family type IV pilus assembly protein [Dinoroseobacter sp. PD6]|uniref:TadE/TadG family type IV pilus assembly protein n=1 Tax=Dinoroseobacter sp. PD6 TaxID=3028384 RepID=UPI00237A3619|nr:TadE/TadG family type IV pilus assembly protein [Dinoroseobacter sp. PD6]MDD9716482.1 TadE/TadG family type IV pilus assembly protein [Dinoroseobacter sp. PD6]
MIRGFRKFLCRDERGTATVEFVIVFPLIIAVFMSTFEAAMLTAKYTMMERALDITIRELRLNANAPLSESDVKDRICNETLLISDCRSTIVVEMTTINPPVWSWPNTRAACADRINNTLPVVTYTQAQANRLVLVRLCTVVDPWFPLTGLGLALSKDASGGYQMTTASAFVAEP